MADGMNVKVTVKVDESELKSLDSELQKLTNITSNVHFNYNKALGELNKIKSTLQDKFNIPINFDVKNAKDVKRITSELQTLANHMRNAIETGLNMDSISLGSTKSVAGVNRKFANAFTSQQTDLLSNLKKQYSDLNLEMPEIDTRDMENSIAKAYQNIHKIQEKSKSMLQDGVMEKLEKSYGNTDAFKKLKQGMDTIDWTDFTTGFERAQQLLTAFGQEAGVQFTSLRQDAIEFVGAMDNVSDSIQSFSINKSDTGNPFEHIEDSAKKVEKAFDVVTNGADALKKSLGDGNYNKILDFITESLKKADVEIDKLDGDVSSFLQNVQTRFDKTGKLVSASVSGTVNDITMAWNMGTNEQGGLAFGTASITDHTQTNAVQKLASNYKELLSLKKQLAQLDSKGYVNEAADVKSTISALERENTTLKSLINNKQKVQQLTDNYTASLSRQSAHQSDVTQAAEDVEAVKKYTSAMKEALQLQSEISKLQVSGETNTEHYADLQNRMERLKDTLGELGIAYNKYDNTFSHANTKNLAAGVTNTTEKYKELTEAVTEFQYKSNSVAASQTDAVRYNQDKEALNQYVVALKEAKQAQSLIASKEGKNEFNTEQIEQARNTIQNFIPILEQLGITYDEVTNSFQINYMDAQSLNGLLQSSQNIDQLIQKLREFQQQTERTQASQADTRMNNTYNKAVEALNKYIAKRKELAQAEKSGMSDSGLENMRQDCERLQTEAEQAEQSLKELGNATRSVKFDNFKTDALREMDTDIDKIRTSTNEMSKGFDSAFSSIGQFAAMTGIFDGIQAAISNVREEIVELNTAMTELQIVTETSDASIEKTMAGYADMAKDLGVTLQTVAEGAGEWLRQGFSEADTATLLKASTMLSTVGNMGADEASTALTSIINGFGMATDQATHVIDTLDALDLAYATSTSELAEGLQRSASVAKTAGMSFEDLASIMTVVSSTTRLSGETIGNGMKSLFSRLQNIKVGKYVSDTGEQLNDVEKVLNKLGIKLRTSATEWREPMQILQEVGEGWSKFTDIDKSAIATALGGTYQRNTLMSILENWEKVSEAQEVAANSAGTSAQKYDIYLNSMQAHINELKTVWSEFLMKIADSGAINGAIDGLSNFIKILQILVTETPLGTIAITALTAALSGLAVTKAASGIISIAQGLTKLKTLNTFVQGLFGIDAAAVAAAGGVTTLGAAFATIAPYIAIIAAVGTAIYALTKIIDAAVVSDKELQESIDGHKDSINSIQSEIDNYNQKLDDNKSRLEEINSLKGTSQWSSDLQEEADSIEKQNTALEHNIELQERLLALEQQALLDDQKEQYKRDYTDQEYTGMEDGQTKKYTGIDAVAKQWEDATGYIKAYKSEMDKVDTLSQKVQNSSSEEQKTYKQQLKAAQERAKTYSSIATDQEKSLTEEIQKIEETRDAFKAAGDAGDSEAKEMADSLDDLLSRLYGLPTAATGFDTIGEALGYTTSSMNDTRSAAEQLRDEFVKINGTEVKPKDADDMVSWLNSLSETDFSHVQDVLMGCGDAADVLKEALNNLSGDQAAQLLTEAWKIYNGELDDANEKISTFQNSKKTDWNKQLSDVAEAYNYIKDYQKGTEVDYQTYKAALDLMGLSTEEVANDTSVLNQKLAASQKYLGADGTQRNYKTFLNDVTTLSKDAANNMNDFGKKIVEVSTDSAGNTKMVVNDLHALGQELNLSDTEVQALLNGMKQFGDVEINPSTTLLQSNLADTYNAIDALNKKRAELMSNSTIALNTDNLPQTKQELVDIGNQLNQMMMERYGITFDINTTDIGETRSEVAGLSGDINDAATAYKNMFSNSGELNVDKVSEAINKVNSQVQDSDLKLKFDADTQSIENITSETIGKLNDALGGDTGVTAAVLNSLQGGFGEVDWAAMLKTENLDATLKTTIEGISGKLSQIKAPETQAWAQAIEAAAKGCGETVSSTLEAALNKVAAVNGQSELLKTIDSQTTTNKSNIASVAAALISLKGTADSATAYVNAQLSAIKVPSSVSSVLNGGTVGKVTKPATGVAPIGYATGGVYGKQDGKDPAGREHLTATQNYNAVVGEIGEELVVHRDGTSQIVGRKGAELVHLDKGDTVIPANVTSLIQQGRISGYPTGGTATLHGVSNQNGVSPTESRTSSSNKSSKSSSKSSSGSSSGSSSSKSSSGSSSSSSGTNEAAENELKALEHQRKMEYITEKQYAQKYEAIWKKYYKDKKEYQDKDWEMQEKLHDLQKTFFEDSISMLEEENDKLQRNAGTEQKQIANYQQMQQLYHDRAEQYRKQGFTDDSPEIRELSKSWWEMYDKINDLRTQMFDNYINDFDHTIDLIDSRMDRIDDYVIRVTKDSAMTFDELEKDLGNYLDNKISLYKQKAIAINAQLVAVNTELNRLYKEGYEKNKENIQKLEKQAEELKNNIHDIAENIRQENLDNIQRELDYQEKLRSAVKQYAQDQVDKIQDQIDKLEEENDALDKQKEKKKLLEALDSSKQKNKRVYYADKGWVNYMPIINYIG